MINEDNIGLAINMWLIVKRHRRVFAATGDNRLANKAAWHTYGLIWLFGWGTVGTLMFGFLCVFWLGFLVPLFFCLACLVGCIVGWQKDQEWEAKLTATAIEPPPIPSGRSIPAEVPIHTTQVQTAYYREPARRIRSSQRAITRGPAR